MAGRSRRGMAGFTLVEVMVAIVIGGLVTLTAAATATAVPDLASGADIRLNETLRTVAVRRQIRDWLTASYATGDSAFAGEFLGYDGPVPGSDALRFQTLNADPLLPGRALLSIAIAEPGSGEKGLVAIITPDRGRSVTLPLAPEATGLEVQYLYLISGNPRWFDGWSSSVERPAAVRLQLSGAGLPELLQLPITVWLQG